MKSYDCIIVGGGIVGVSFALMLAQLHYRVLLVEKNEVAQTPDPFEARTVALSFASQQIYTALGIWSKLADQAIPIQQLRVNMKGSYGSSQLSGNKKRSALGYVVSLHALEKALYAELASIAPEAVVRPAILQHWTSTLHEWQVEINTQGQLKSLNTHLLVAADGVQSPLRESQQIGSQCKQYGHNGIMTNFRMSKSLEFTALERFLKQGAIALLPWQENLATCVWTIPAQERSYLMSLSNEEFIIACQQQLGSRMGKIQACSTRACFPLQMHLATSQSAFRFLLLGNAAHALHPIAAQGLNLSLRDIWQIRSQLLRQPNEKKDIGEASFLNEYLQARQSDQNRMIFATDKIARFMSGGPLPGWLRAMGITLFDSMTPLRQVFTHSSMGL